MIGIASLLETGLNLVDKFVETPEEKNATRLKIMEMADKQDERGLQAEIQQLLGQIEVNKIEAASTNLFKSGWRPAVGWTCAIAYFYKFIGQPFAVFIALLFVPDFPVDSLPHLEWTEMATVLMGMLGLSYHRSNERKAGKIPVGQ